MERKKIKYYVLLIAVIMALSFFLPYLIRAGTDLIVDRIVQEETQTETGPETEAVAETGTEGKMSVTIDDGKSGQKQEGAESRMHPDAGQGNANKIGADVTMHAGSSTEPSMPAETEDEVQADKAAYDEKLAAYRQMGQIEFSETHKDGLQQFIGERKEAFSAAISDYVYSLYGDSLTVTKVDVVEFVKEDDTEATYQIQAFATSGKKEYSECFISTYNKKHGFYSIYAYEKM